jgi:hypothetical protein
MTYASDGATGGVEPSTVRTPARRSTAELQPPHHQVPTIRAASSAFAGQGEAARVQRMRGRHRLREDGGIDWETNCPDCGAQFSIWTRAQFKDFRRRCDNCKRPGKPVRSRRKSVTLPRTVAEPSHNSRGEGCNATVTALKGRFKP